MDMPDQSLDQTLIITITSQYHYTINRKISCYVISVYPFKLIIQ